MTKRIELPLGQNRFKVSSQVLPEHWRLFDFIFYNFEDFKNNKDVKRTIARFPDFHRLSLKSYDRTWKTEEGRQYRTFYHCVLERNHGKSWKEFGRFEKEVKELPLWQPNEELLPDWAPKKDLPIWIPSLLA